MTARIFYIAIDRGYVDSSLVNIRRIAIEYMEKDRSIDTIPVYTSATKDCEVGTVIRAPSHRFKYIWSYYTKGKPTESPMSMDGIIRHHG